MAGPAPDAKPTAPLVVGRYAVFDELAAGGMATVHYGRVLGLEGPQGAVAVKRLHGQYTDNPEFCAMFLDEARLVRRIEHANCVRTVDVVQADAGLFLVMEYVHGESLSRLLRSAREKGERVSPRLVATLLHGVLLGLHAAHEATDAQGKLLHVVHRDVSPQNVIVDVAGGAKVLDFGIAKAAGRMQTTREGQIKGKLTYMAPEQIRGQVDRRTDVFAASVVLWEALAGRRMHEGSKDVEIVTRVVQGRFVPPSTYSPEISRDLDEVALKGLAPDPKRRYASARDMARALEECVGLVDSAEIGAFVLRHASAVLEKRARKLAAFEAAARGLVADEPSPEPTRTQTRHTQLTPSGTALPIALPEVDARPASRVFQSSNAAMAVGGFFVVAIAAAAVGGYALARREQGRSMSSSPVRTADVSPTPPPGFSAVPATPEALATPAPPTTATLPAPEMPMTVASAGNETTVADAPAVKAGAARVGGKPAAAASAKPCEPAYTVDDAGHKQFKPECMGF